MLPERRDCHASCAGRALTQAAAATTPNATCAVSVIQSRAWANHGKTSVKPCMFTAQKPGSVAGPDQRAHDDGVHLGDERGIERLEQTQRLGEFLDLLGLSGCQIGGFQIARIILALGLAAGIGGGGVGFLCRLFETQQLRAQLFTYGI